uniref:Chromophore lyase cpcS/cpeS n=1 Tax=Bangiopsis subsimplex TaxID=139980 RepID=A0A1C9CCP5_9RHOD|nr:hypothetical protein Bangp_067 [Bangiopsis subsimplex]AOM66149.1 hypothetical protein Bangp_067 [Bangiopsis subsimplex]ARO90491.1 chromophore lyase cpcS/cpeS [Bangiopsis subsimplex]
MQINKLISDLEGKWLAQQTLYNISLGISKSHKYEVYYKKNDNIKYLGNFLLPTEKTQNLEILWTNNITTTNGILNYMILFIISNQNNMGRFIKWNKNKPGSLVKGNFMLNQYNILTCTSYQKDYYIVEKIYTPGENLKLSTCVIKKYKICIFVSFISEIKYKKA